MAPKPTYELLPADGTQELVNHYQHALDVAEARVLELKDNIENNQESVASSGRRATRSGQHPLHKELMDAENEVDYFEKQKRKAVQQFRKYQVDKDDHTSLQRLTALNTQFNKKSSPSSLEQSVQKPHPGQTTASWKELLKSSEQPHNSATQLAETINRSLNPSNNDTGSFIAHSPPFPPSATNISDTRMSSPLSSANSSRSSTPELKVAAPLLSPVSDIPEPRLEAAVDGLLSASKVPNLSLSSKEPGSEQSGVTELQAVSSDAEDSQSINNKNESNNQEAPAKPRSSVLQNSPDQSVIGEDEMEKLIALTPKLEDTSEKLADRRKPKPKAVSKKRAKIQDTSDDEKDETKKMELCDWGGLPVNSNYRHQLEEKARGQIKGFLAGTTKTLHLNIRKNLRTYSDFIPEAGALAYELSIHILTTRAGNISCRHHQLNDKSSGGEWDGMDGKPQHGRLTGIPWDRRFKAGKTATVDPLEGFGHCGCNLDDIVYDFFIFKDSELTSTNINCSDLKEGWNTQHLNPRIRGLFINTLQRMAGIQNVRDLFKYVWNERYNRFVRHSPSDILGRRITRLAEQLQKLKAEEAEIKPKELSHGVEVYFLGANRTPDEVAAEMRAGRMDWLSMEEFEDMSRKWEARRSEEERLKVLEGMSVVEGSGSKTTKKRHRQLQSSVEDEESDEVDDDVKRQKLSEQLKTKEAPMSTKAKGKMRVVDTEERRDKKHDHREKKQDRLEVGDEIVKETTEERRLRKLEKKARKKAKQQRREEKSRRE